MSAVPVPDDEALRLETLACYAIMDTGPDKSFDNLVKLAADHFGVSVALVSLVGADRQWFKASVGMDIRETPREVSFCAHAIMQPDEILVVENAAEDPRFAHNPLVVGEPAIRFYAGAPICADNGQPLGTICVIDSRVRSLDPAGRQFLMNLASSAGSMLELHRLNVALTVASGRDALTGMANRRSFDTALSGACEKLAANGSFGLLVLDLDRFKEVNDTLGHEAGDRLLQEVGRRLERVVRDKDLAARLGGDEFAVVASGPVDLPGLTGMAHRILQAFAIDFRYHDHLVPIRASIGIAMAPLHGDEAGMLSRAADAALYRAKRAGQQSIVLATAPDGYDAGATAERELVAAIARATLPLSWQPYCDTSTGKVCGYEALVCWDRSGSVAEMAARGGYIGDLEKLLLCSACAAAAAWPEPLAVSVNLSAWWFSNDDLLGLVTAVMERTGLAPTRLTIELTEITLVRHTDRARELIEGLRAKGVRIGLDDFGTGYSSLRYLHTFAFDVLKLDRSFAAGLGISQKAEAVTHAIIALGRALNMAVCAQGIETDQQLRFLQTAGCEMAQGSLLGQPEAHISWAGRSR